MSYNQGYFIQSTLNYFGFPYIFTIILVSSIVAMLTYFAIKRTSAGMGEGKGLKDSTILAISFLIGISFAILLSFVNGIITFFEYFSGMIAIMLLAIFFVFVIAMFITGRTNVISSGSSQSSSSSSSGSSFNPRTVALLTLILIIVIFGFLSFYLSYQNYLLQYTTPTTSQGFIAYLILQPPILIIPFIFAIIGLAILIIR